MTYLATAYLCVSLLNAPAGTDISCQRFFAPPVKTLSECQEVVSEFEAKLELDLLTRGYRLESVEAHCFSMPIRKGSTRGGGHMKEAI